MGTSMLEPGLMIDGKYRVVRHIGEGGMGAVYEGEHVRIGKRVAIKVLHKEVAQQAEFIERFEREAMAAARIRSPHVCDVMDLGNLPNGDRFIVMEFLEGESLEDRLEGRGKLTPAELAPIAYEIGEALSMMHEEGVIHRDLKPANVFLSRTTKGRGEIVKILDFGVAKVRPLGGADHSMTRTGAMMGTPLYMSPEQARGARDVDARTDVYAASVICYRALTGELPHMADALNELLFKIVLEDPRPIAQLAPEVDEAFAAIIHHGLAREPDQRIPSARAFMDEIATWGRAQGRPSLSFAISPESAELSSMPKISAKARLAETVAPETTKSASGSLPPPSPGSKQTPQGGGNTPAGTPLSWDKSGRSSPSLERREQTLAMATPEGAAPAAAAKTPLATPAPSHGPQAATAATPQARRNPLVLLALGGALLAIPATYYATRASSAAVAPPSGSAVPSASVVAAPPSEPSAATATATATATAEPASPSAEPAAASATTEPAVPSASATPAGRSASSPPPAGVHPKVAGRADAAPSGIAAPATSVAPAASVAPATSAHGRKFRTSLD